MLHVFFNEYGTQPESLPQVTTKLRDMVATSITIIAERQRCFGLSFPSEVTEIKKEDSVDNIIIISHFVSAF